MPRKDLRRPAHEEVTLIFGDRGKIRCRMSDISQNGARLEIPYMEWLPRLFELQDSRGLRRHVELTWQGQNKIGVRFVDKPPRRANLVPTFGRRGLKPEPKR